MNYPWIDITPVTRASRADLGWTIADCMLCGKTSCENAEPYTEDWVHEHAQTCHPRWTVRKGPCARCVAFHADPERWSNVWVIYNASGSEFGCRETFKEAQKYADRKAREFLRVELMGMMV